jgi:hypothetical protein
MKKAISIIVLTLLLLSTVAFFASAEEESIIVPPATLWERIKVLFSTFQFTIVGQDNHADDYPRFVPGMVGVPTDYHFIVDKGTGFEVPAWETRQFCNGKSGLWNVFAGWTPMFEAIDNINFDCDVQPCRVQLYCMPYLYPPTQTNCDNWGKDQGYEIGSVVRRTKNQLDPHMPLYKFEGTTHTLQTSYIYCDATDACTGPPITCWRVENSECVSRNYDCTYTTYPNCPSTYPYTSKAQCEGTIKPDPSVCDGLTLNQCTANTNCEWYAPNPYPTPGVDRCIVKGTAPVNGNGNGDEEYESDPQAGQFVIYGIEYPTGASPGEEVTIKYKIKNNGPAGTYLIETGIIPKKVAQAWGFDVKTFSIFGLFSIFNPQCCEGQENIYGKLQHFNKGQIHSFSVKVKVPYEGIPDLCYDNKYWDGSGEYALYIHARAKTKFMAVLGSYCYPEGKALDTETRKIIVGEGTSLSEYTATQLSLTRRDLDMATSSIILQATCSVSQNCLPYVDDAGSDDYSVKCVATPLYKEKINQAAKEVCKAPSLFSFKFLTASTATICAGSLAIAIATAGAATPISSTICATAIAGAVAVGGGAVAYEVGCEMVKSEAGEGLCIASPKGATPICDFFEKAAFFNITGDACTDGIIIVLILLLLGVVIFSRLAG